MAEVVVGLTHEFEDRTARVRVVDGVEIGVFRLGDAFFAYENRCAHAGGPVCQGKIMARVVEHVAEGGELLGQSFSKTDVNIVCPWHGYEYDIRTGLHQGDTRHRLRRFPLRVEGGRILVTV